MTYENGDEKKEEDILVKRKPLIIEYFIHSRKFE